MDGGPWWAAVHGVTKSRTRLSDFTFAFYFPALEEEMATQSSVLAWRISGTGEPGGLPSMGLHRVGHDWSDLAAAVKKPNTSVPFPHIPSIVKSYQFYLQDTPNPSTLSPLIPSDSQTTIHLDRNHCRSFLSISSLRASTQGPLQSVHLAATRDIFSKHKLQHNTLLLKIFQ